MTYVYCEDEKNDRYATNLRIDTSNKKLTWDSSAGQDVLLVETKYGKDPADEIERLCKALPNVTLGSGFVEVLAGVSCKIVSAVEKTRDGGCAVKSQATRYTIFCYIKQDDTFTIFAPKQNAMISNHIDIPLEINIFVQEVTKSTGVLMFKKEVPTGFYSISFPNDISEVYTDGDIEYEVSNFKFPITKKMIANKTVYVKTNNKPRLKSINGGITIK